MLLHVYANVEQHVKFHLQVRTPVCKAAGISVAASAETVLAASVSTLSRNAFASCSSVTSCNDSGKGLLASPNAVPRLWVRTCDGCCKSEA